MFKQLDYKRAYVERQRQAVLNLEEPLGRASANESGYDV